MRTFGHIQHPPGLGTLNWVGQGQPRSNPNQNAHEICIHSRAPLIEMITSGHQHCIVVYKNNSVQFHSDFPSCMGAKNKTIFKINFLFEKSISTHVFLTRSHQKKMTNKFVIHLKKVRGKLFINDSTPYDVHYFFKFKFVIFLKGFNASSIKIACGQFAPGTLCPLGQVRLGQHSAFILCYSKLEKSLDVNQCQLS